jgi:hypothetical protein
MTSNHARQGNLPDATLMGVVIRAFLVRGTQDNVLSTEHMQGPCHG